MGSCCARAPAANKAGGTSPRPKPNLPRRQHSAPKLSDGLFMAILREADDSIDTFRSADSTDDSPNHLGNVVRRASKIADDEVGGSIKTEWFLQFLKKENKETTLDAEGLRRRMAAVSEKKAAAASHESPQSKKRPRTHNRHDGPVDRILKDDWSAEEATLYLTNPSFNGVSDSKTVPRSYYDAPISEFYINSSHNTYLTGGQYAVTGGRADVDAYRRAIEDLDCRCVEVDLYDGPDQKPIVMHFSAVVGGGQLLFEDVVDVVNRAAFSKKGDESFPLVLNIENHVKQQGRVVAEIILKHFGARILTADDDTFGHAARVSEGFTHPPTVNELRGRVLVRSKIKAGDSGFFNVAPPSSNNSDDEYSLTLMQDPSKIKCSDRCPQELARLFYFVNSSFEGVDFHKPFWSTSSLSLKKVSKFSKLLRNSLFVDSNFMSSDSMTTSPSNKQVLEVGTVELLSNVSHKYLLRSFPNSMALASQNYDPVPMWALGFQLVALNFQTAGYEMDLNAAMFARTNDRSGFVRKPQVLRKGYPTFVPVAPGMMPVTKRTRRFSSSQTRKSSPAPVVSIKRSVSNESAPSGPPAAEMIANPFAIATAAEDFDSDSGDSSEGEAFLPVALRKANEVDGEEILRKESEVAEARLVETLNDAPLVEARGRSLSSCSKSRSRSNTPSRRTRRGSVEKFVPLKLRALAASSKSSSASSPKTQEQAEDSGYDTDNASSYVTSPTSFSPRSCAPRPVSLEQALERGWMPPATHRVRTLRLRPKMASRLDVAFGIKSSASHYSLVGCADDEPPTDVRPSSTVHGNARRFRSGSKELDELMNEETTNASSSRSRSSSLTDRFVAAVSSSTRRSNDGDSNRTHDSTYLSAQNIDNGVRFRSLVVELLVDGAPVDKTSNSVSSDHRQLEWDDDEEIFFDLSDKPESTVLTLRLVDNKQSVASRSFFVNALRPGDLLEMVLLEDNSSGCCFMLSVGIEMSVAHLRDEETFERLNTVNVTIHPGDDEDVFNKLHNPSKISMVDLVVVSVLPAVALDALDSQLGLKSNRRSSVGDNSNKKRRSSVSKAPARTKSSPADAAARPLVARAKSSPAEATTTPPPLIQTSATTPPPLIQKERSEYANESPLESLKRARAERARRGDVDELPEAPPIKEMDFTELEATRRDFLFDQLDPRVELSVCGLPVDNARKMRTPPMSKVRKAISKLNKDSSKSDLPFGEHHPMSYMHRFHVSSTWSELTFLTLTMRSKRQSRGGRTRLGSITGRNSRKTEAGSHLGSSTLHVDSLRPGYRSVPLFTDSGKHLFTLLVHVGLKHELTRKPIVPTNLFGALELGLEDSPVKNPPKRLSLDVSNDKTSVTLLSPVIETGHTPQTPMPESLSAT